LASNAGSSSRAAPARLPGASSLTTDSTMSPQSLVFPSCGPGRARPSRCARPSSAGHATTTTPVRC